MGRLVALVLLSVLSRSASKNVAIIMAGQERGSYDTAADFGRALVAPLQKVGWKVHLYAGIFVGDESKWEKWIADAYPAPDEKRLVRLPSDESMDPGLVKFFNQCAQPYGLRNAHLEMAMRAAVDSKVDYSYAIKARNDVHYSPSQFFKPCWLAGLRNNEVLINDKELHCGDRWAERGWANFAQTFGKNLPPDTSAWMAQYSLPLTTSDQFAAGTWETMQIMLSIASAEPNDQRNCSEGNAFWEWAGGNYYTNPENVFAEFMYRRKMRVSRLLRVRF